MNRLRMLTIALILLPLLVLIVSIVLAGVDVPYWDQWALVPTIEKMYDGTLSFSDVWEQHNEHRIFFPKLIMLGLAKLSHWNIFWELGANVVLGIGIFVVLQASVRTSARQIGERLPWYALPLLSLLVFSLSQTQNWYWGWQVQIFLSVLAVAAGLLVLGANPLSWKRLIGAILLGTVATHSFANGVVFWPVGLGVILLAPNAGWKQKRSRAVIWLIASFCILGTFFYHYHPGDPEFPQTYAWCAFCIKGLLYVISYVGIPVLRYHVGLAFMCGLYGLLVSLWLIWRVRNKPELWQQLLPYLALMCYVLVSAVVTAVGRTKLGATQAISSRYVTIANLFWVGHFMLVWLNLREKMLPLFLQYSSCMLIIGLIINSMVALVPVKEHQHRLNQAKQVLLERTEDEAVLYLYPSKAALMGRAAVLEKYGLSLYRQQHKSENPVAK